MPTATQPTEHARSLSMLDMDVRANAVHDTGGLYGEGWIEGVPLIEVTTEATGHGYGIDRTTCEQALALLEEAGPNGISAVYRRRGENGSPHDKMPLIEREFGRIVPPGKFDGQTVRADLHFVAEGREVQLPNLSKPFDMVERVKAKARRSPRELGMSAEMPRTTLAQTDSGLALRMLALRAAGLVDRPAATSGLLAEGEGMELKEAAAELKKALAPIMDLIETIKPLLEGGASVEAPVEPPVEAEPPEEMMEPPEKEDEPGEDDEDPEKEKEEQMSTPPAKGTMEEDTSPVEQPKTSTALGQPDLTPVERELAEMRADVIVLKDREARRDRSHRAAQEFAKRGLKETPQYLASFKSDMELEVTLAAIDRRQEIQDNPAKFPDTAVHQTQQPDPPEVAKCRALGEQAYQVARAEAQRFLARPDVFEGRSLEWHLTQQLARQGIDYPGNGKGE